MRFMSLAFLYQMRKKWARAREKKRQRNMFLILRVDCFNSNIATLRTEFNFVRTDRQILSRSSSLPWWFVWFHFATYINDFTLVYVGEKGKKFERFFIKFQTDFFFNSSHFSSASSSFCFSVQSLEFKQMRQKNCTNGLTNVEWH